MSDCQAIDCCETGVYTYGLTGTLTPGPPVIVVDPPVYRLVFFDDFNGENGGSPSLDYTGWQNWESMVLYVSGSPFLSQTQTVDLRDYTTAGYPPGFAIRRLFVDMFGSSSGFPEDGLLQTKQPITFVPGTYRLSFLLAGSQIGQDLVLNVQIGSGFSRSYGSSGFSTQQSVPIVEENILVPVLQDFTLHTLEFTFTTQQIGKIVFYCAQVPSSGNAGVLVDDVKLEQIA